MYLAQDIIYGDPPRQPDPKEVLPKQLETLIIMFPEDEIIEFFENLLRDIKHFPNLRGVEIELPQELGGDDSESESYKQYHARFKRIEKGLLRAGLEWAKCVV